MHGLLIACIAVFIFLFSIVYFDYVKSVQKNKYVEWDFLTMTAGDYSIEFDITSKFVDNFLKTAYDETNPISEVMQLKLFIKDELERRLGEQAFKADEEYDQLGSRRSILNTSISGQEQKTIKVGLITFAFNNAEVIQWLKERGNHIKNEDWDKLDKINNKIAY